MVKGTMTDHIGTRQENKIHHIKCVFTTQLSFGQRLFFGMLPNQSLTFCRSTKTVGNPKNNPVY